MDVRCPAEGALHAGIAASASDFRHSAAGQLLVGPIGGQVGTGASDHVEVVGRHGEITANPQLVKEGQQRLLELPLACSSGQAVLAGLGRSAAARTDSQLALVRSASQKQHWEATR